MPADLPPSRVLDWFAANPAVTGAGQARHATALLARGREAEAVELARAAWRDADFPRDVEQAFYARFGRFLTPDDERGALRAPAVRAARRRRPAPRPAALGPGFAEAGHRAAQAGQARARRRRGDRAGAAAPCATTKGWSSSAPAGACAPDRFRDALELVDPVPVTVEHPRAVVGPARLDGAARPAAGRGLAGPTAWPPTAA